MGLLPDTWNSGLRMRRECQERFSCHRLQMKSVISDPDMHHGTCVTHVPWYMSRSLIHSGRENVPGNPGVCATLNFTYLARGPWYLEGEGICWSGHSSHLYERTLVWSEDCHVIEHQISIRPYGSYHCSDVIIGIIASPASRLFTQPFIEAQIIENIKALRQWPLCREFTDDRWIPYTNGQ